MSHAFQAPALPTTTADFLVWPGDGRAKTYHLVDGQVIAMAPGSATHGLIQANLGGIIRNRLLEKRSPCRVITEAAVVPRVRAKDNVRIADVLVTCSPVAAGQAVAADPVLIAEVLSPSNASRTWANVWAYTTVPSVAEILIVHSTRVRAHLLRRLPDGSWPEVALDVEDGATLDVRTADLTVALRDLYEGTHLV